MSGHIRRRGANSFELKYDVARDGGGRRTVYTSVKGSRRQAQNELTRLLAQAAEGGHVEPSKLTVGEHLRARFEHWKITKVISKLTAQRYRELIENDIVPYLGARPLQRLNTRDVEAWHTALMARGLGARTIGHAHRVLSKAISEAMKHGLVMRNVCTLERAPKVAAEEIKILTPSQVNELPALLHGDPLEAPALVALHTGMRRGELLALKWGNVDLEDEIIRVRESLEQTRGGLRFKEPKSRAGVRDITLPAIVVDVLQAHRKRELERRLLFGQGRPSDKDLIFPTWDGSPWAPNVFGVAWSRLSRKLGLGVSFHALRHTHASYLIDLGIDVVTISKRLGHSSPAITLNIYAHLFRKDDGKAAAAINAALGG
jgi:integrase